MGCCCGGLFSHLQQSLDRSGVEPVASVGQGEQVNLHAHLSVRHPDQVILSHLLLIEVIEGCPPPHPRQLPVCHKSDPGLGAPIKST